MNIQLQNNAYIPKRGVGGGPVSYLTHGSRALAGRGHAVSILCRRSDVDRLPWATVRQYDYGRIHGRQWLLEPLILARRLRRVVRQHAAGVELALVRNPFFAYAMATAMPGVPMIYITPGNAAREFAINYLLGPGVKTRAFHLLQRAQYRYIEATALRRSPHIVVFTQIWRRELMDSYGVHATKISVLPPGVTLDSPEVRRDDTVYDELGIPPEAPIVLCVCRLVRQKNLPFLVRAFAALRHRGAYLVVVGEGPEKASLARVVAEA
ncbi:MAG TPA: glycosyltransferase, partial [Candidatus Sulfotelmatobacter sp.]|nr:glycosyltransferase [Candidatus Sulfotelmatobacter sp.]